MSSSPPPPPPPPPGAAGAGGGAMVGAASASAGAAGVPAGLSAPSGLLCGPPRSLTFFLKKFFLGINLDLSRRWRRPESPAAGAADSVQVWSEARKSVLGSRTRSMRLCPPPVLSIVLNKYMGSEIRVESGARKPSYPRADSFLKLHERNGFGQPPWTQRPQPKRAAGPGLACRCGRSQGAWLGHRIARPLVDGLDRRAVVPRALAAGGERR